MLKEYALIEKGKKQNRPAKCNKVCLACKGTGINLVLSTTQDCKICEGSGACERCRINMR